ncbi:MAG TPA: response regulator transcription factor [Gemmatimonadales bacterium]|nr:response regulator transcription factor [Gemmatimonadales bacterium]
MATSVHSSRQAHRARGHERNLVLVGSAPAEAAHPRTAIRVLLAHGDRLARAGLEALVDAEPDVTVAGAAADGTDAVALARELRPDVLLIDIAVDGLDAGTVTRRVLADADTSSVRVLVLGASDDEEEVLSSLRAGASGFLVTDAEPAELIAGIRSVAAGEPALSPRGVRRLIAELAAQPDPGRASPELLEELTARELEVMTLVAGGLSNDQIAEQLVVTPATAKTHVSRVMTKLRARHRAQLVTLAYETGLVQPRHPAGDPRDGGAASFAHAASVASAAGLASA